MRGTLKGANCERKRKSRRNRARPVAWLNIRVQQIFAVLVAIGFLLLPMPGFAARSSSIAVARLTGTAVRNGVPLPNGGIVFSGDVVSTGRKSSLQLAASPQERLWLGADTSAKLAKDGRNLVVALDRGTVGFASRGHVRVTIGGRDFSLESPSASPVLARLAYVHGQEAQLWLERGSLEVEQNGHAVLLEAGPSGLTSTIVGKSPARPSAFKALMPQMQTGNGGVKGTVVNTKLFAVPGVTITLVSSTGVSYTATSNNEGVFVFNNISPGIYTLSVSRRCYTTYQQKLTVVAGAQSSAYVELKGQKACGPAAGGNNNALIIGVVAGAAAAGLGTGLYFALRTTKKPSPSTF